MPWSDHEHFLWLQICLRKYEMDAKGAIPLDLLLGNLRGNVSPVDQHAAGRIFASLLNGNDEQRFFVDIYLSDTWYPQRARTQEI